MFKNNLSIANFDPDLWDAIQKESKRQEEHIELIASENYTSPMVLAAQGSALNNKYAEGYPGKRYYGGCEYVDIVENLAIDRVKKLFGADFANVQPHSGSQANAAAYFACIAHGDTIMGMDLSAGGHLTHGSKVNFSGKIYNAIAYGLNEKTGEIDYAQVEKLARLHKPKLIMTGFSAYSRIVDWEKFRQIANEAGSFLISDIAHVAGLIAAQLYPSPIKIADITTSTTHKTLRGPRSGIIMAKSNPDLEKKINSAVFPGLQGGPLCHVIAAKAIAFKEAMLPEFKIYQEQVVKNSKAMAKIVMQRGYDVVSGGTDNHLFLLSLINKEITGKDALEALAKANITANKNSVPNDPRSPMITSGLRLGTPAVTTRGFKENEIEQIAHWICDILDDINNQKTIEHIKKEALDLCAKFPVYEK
ncbi:MAG TPA: serine hydroxymethyltransferase [Coxiellaceae bacterium]|nr:MAG: serine hydroxymethyltransferase [Gammaproteobacteria bacterium RBG_16_37_9]HBC71732.1 serine hydroxymethyltransferase [Coxiellaceae bacterium]